MTTAQQQQHLLTFPHISVYHLPTPTSPPILLAQGDLVLSLLPASPPDHPKEVLTISITRTGDGTGDGAHHEAHEATFLIKEGTPVVKTDTNHEHASYLFAPALPDSHADVGLETSTSTAAGKDLGPNGGELGTPTTTTLPATLNQLGKIKLVPSHSTSPEQYTETERLASHFQQILETHKCWKEQGWYDIEDELAAAAGSGAGAGYGTTIADTLGYYGRVVADRIAGLTHGTATTASLPTTPSTSTTTTTTAPLNPSTTTAKQTFSSTAHLTHQISSYTHTASSTLTHAVHDGAAYLGSLAAGVVGTGSSSSPSASSAFNEGKEAGERGDVIDLQQSQQGGATSAAGVAGAAARNFGQAGLETWEEVKLGVVDGVGRYVFWTFFFFVFFFSFFWFWVGFWRFGFLGFRFWVLEYEVVGSLEFGV